MIISLDAVRFFNTKGGSGTKGPFAILTKLLYQKGISTINWFQQSFIAKSVQL